MLMWVSSDGCIEKLFYLRKYDTEVKSKLAKANLSWSYMEQVIGFLSPNNKFLHRCSKPDIAELKKYNNRFI